MARGPSAASPRAIPFATASGLPVAPPGTRLRRVTFRSCPGSDLELRVVRDVRGDSDAHGVPEDAWWCVHCSDLPDRVMRLTRGARSLRSLLRRYGFLDAQDCVNHRDATAEYAPKASALPPYRLHVPPALLDATGVPQFYPTSGNCWFAALCWSSFSNPAVRRFLSRYMPDDDMRQLCATCLSSRDQAEKLRKRLWYDYAVGDDVDDRPENDGRNGFTEFSVMCAKLGVPMLRYREVNGVMRAMPPELTDRKGKRVRAKLPATPAEPHLLVLRYQDGNHHTRFPIRRRVCHGGVRYRLYGLYQGQRKCGHQIGASSPTGSWRDWGLGDADLHKDGIGPIFVHFEGDCWRGDAWWEAWRELVHVTKFGPGNREFCNLNWHNLPDNRYDAFRGSKVSGENSIDVCYASESVWGQAEVGRGRSAGARR